MFVCLCVYLFICLFVYLFVYLFICLFVYLFICLFVYLFICLFAYMFICLFAYMFICLFVYLFIYLFIYLFVYLFIYLFVIRINCTTGMSTKENSGPISVSVKGEMAESVDTYSYLLPTVTSVNTLFPNGSLSATLAGVSEGGTLLQFNGTNLGIVSEISIKDEINCFIQNGR